MTEGKRQELLKMIQDLRAKLLDREAALPAHSVRPHQLQEIEELEERLAELEEMLGETI